MFVMTEDGGLFVFVVEETAPNQEEAMFSKVKPEFTGELMVDNPIRVKEAPKLKMIATGMDHLVAVDRTGQVWAMGDDTFGQCGQSSQSRSTVAPFFEQRHRTPQKVVIPGKVVRIACGNRHTLAITETGECYGWGYNSMQQLSNAETFADPDNPTHAIFTPALLQGELEGKFVVNAACGEEHSIVVAQVKRDGKPIKEVVYGCGNNLKGQLGINRTSHLQDFTLVEDLSEMYDGLDAD